MTRMKILFVCSGNSIFGISPIVKNQGESLRNNGIQLNYFPIEGKGFRGYKKNIPKLRNHLKSNKYDLIHAHYSYSGLISAFQFNKSPLIISYMGSDAHGSVNADGKRIFISYINIGLSQILQLFVNKIVVKSKNLKKYIFMKNKVTIIPNGVDFKIFKPLDKNECRKELNINKKKKIILFLGDPYNKNKNFKLLENAHNLIKHDDIEIVKPYPVPFKDVVLYLNAADVLDMTSFMEGSPNLIKEAMSCNLPIVTTDVGDVREVIGNTEGCFITSDRPEDVAEKLQLAIYFGKRTNGRENIRHLEINVIAKKIIKIYEDALKL